MKTINYLLIISLSVIFSVGLAACNKPGPAETTGKKIDQTVEKAGNKIGDTVDKVGDKMSEQGEKAATAIEDTEITAKVKASILAYPGLQTLKISVDTINGVVTLSGSANSKSNIDMASTLAGAVAGVKRVENRLVVK